MLGKNNVSDIYLESSPISRYALPEEIANMAIVLCSDMGKSIVGDIVYMTGGAGLITFEDVKYNI
jgi:enoyl-[acyl-carrier-protein] reductase (NADH)